MKWKLKEPYRTRVEAWVAALRSGEYAQGHNCLRFKNAFCCLGVACDVSKLGEWNRETYLGSSVVLPEEVRNYYGIRTSSASTKTKLSDSLIYCNDVHLYGFKKIADCIEQAAIDPEIGLFKEEAYES